jgi:hypothetical protein
MSIVDKYEGMNKGKASEKSEARAEPRDVQTGAMTTQDTMAKER